MRKLIYGMTLDGYIAAPGDDIGWSGPHGIPLHDGDLEAESGIPPAVAHLKDRIAGSAGLLLVTPEYNASIPGVLRNAIDWLSPILGLGASLQGSPRRGDGHMWLLLTDGGVHFGPQRSTWSVGEKEAVSEPDADYLSQSLLNQPRIVAQASSSGIRGPQYIGAVFV